MNAPLGSPDRTPLFSIRNLHVAFEMDTATVLAVDGVDIEVAPGETVGLVGESGSGKSVTVMSALGLLPRGSLPTVTGQVLFDGTDLLAMSSRRRRRLLGKEIGVVFQDPLTSLNPVFSVGSQLAEAVRAHDAKATATTIRKRALEALELVGVAAGSRRLDQFPHELSGGLRQRVMIAQAMINRPRLLIADEPTTALDVTIQAQILEVLKVASAETKASTIFITHDLGVVAGMVDRVVVMYGGRVMESGPVKSIFSASSHPYTVGLLGSIPSLTPGNHRLRPIEGELLGSLQGGEQCPFVGRCRMSRGRDLCRHARPAALAIGEEHRSACHFPAEVADFRGRERLEAQKHDTFLVPNTEVGQSEILRVINISKDFPLKGAVLRRRRKVLQAVTNVSLRVAKGETLAIVGESGSGKSTLGRLILSLIEPSKGQVSYSGFPSFDEDKSVHKLRSEMQIVFQDPYSSLDPRMRIRSIIGEPLVVHRRGTSGQRRERIIQLVGEVGLPDGALMRFPHQLSGGQRQRVGIARALALNPRMLVLDEPVSALDVSVQAQVLNLLEDLQRLHGLTYVFISHDLSVIFHIADRVAVMYMGKVVELGTRDDIFMSPNHPYTQGLLSAIPVPDPDIAAGKANIVIEGEMPDPTDPPSGCRFRTRCWKATDICTQVEPILKVVEGVDHQVACHHAEARSMIDFGPLQFDEEK